jgi:hypothetical protein
VTTSRCAELYATTPARLGTCRAHTHFFLELSKGSIAGASSLAGWLWLTDAQAPPMLNALWPLLLLFVGSYALASASISLFQAAVETSVQCYCEETREAMREQQRRGPAAKGHHALWLPAKA